MRLKIRFGGPTSLSQGTLTAMWFTVLRPPLLQSLFLFLSESHRIRALVLRQPLTGENSALLKQFSSFDVHIVIRTSDSSSTVFDLVLHHPFFAQDFLIAEKLKSEDGSVICVLPAVPVQDGYTLRAVNVG
jgi:hypothetical protein